MDGDTYGLLEDLVIRCILDSCADFLLGSVWIDDTVLPLELRAQIPPVVAIYLLVFLDCSLEFSVYFAHLSFVSWITRRWLTLDLSKPLTKVPVEGHSIRVQSIDFAICLCVLTGVRIIDGALLEEP